MYPEVKWSQFSVNSAATQKNTEQGKRQKKSKGDMFII